MAAEKKFIQIVNLYPLLFPIDEKEDYMLIHDTLMKEKGFDCEIVTLRAQGSRTIETKFAKDQEAVEYYKGFKISRFDTTMQLLNYVRKHKQAIVQSNLRSFPPSSFVGFLGNKKVMRSYTYHMGSNLPIAIFTALIFRRFDRILAVTPYEFDVYRKWKVPEKKLRLIPLSINYEEFAKRVPYGDLREKCGIMEKDKVVIAVANVRKHKRYDVLLKAIPFVKKEIPHVKFVVVGEDMLETAQNLPTLKQMAVDLGVSDSVILTGYQPPHAVREFYSLSDVFVHTAVDEYQGLVSYEAAAIGIPLCLSAIGSHTSVFKENALYHEPEDYRKLAENIIASIKNRGSREACITFLKEHMRNWDYSVIKQKLSEVYDEVISE